jgi:hypothetical protein
MKMLRYGGTIQQLRSFRSIFSIEADCLCAAMPEGWERPASAVQREKKMDREPPNRPRGFVPMGAFFVFGATMAAYAAVTLLKPGTLLDALWVLNKRGHAGLVVLGTGAVLLFAVLSALLGLAAVGWFRRRYWGWILGVTIIAINATGDLINSVMGEWLKGAVGVVIAGLLLIYLTRAGVRSYFHRGHAAIKHSPTTPSSVRTAVSEQLLDPQTQGLSRLLKKGSRKD